MSRLSFLFICLLLTLLSSCAQKVKTADENSLVSIQLIDRNGFAETISTKDRIARYQNTDFSEPQPYQKVMRVFGKTKEGKTPTVITSYHSNGHVSQYLEIVDGRANGKYREWHSNGKLKMELQVIQGIPELSEVALSSWIFDGINRVWDENGSLLAEYSYEKGMLHGDSLYYDPSGFLKKQVPYVQDLIDGTLSYYSKQGTPLETIVFVKGQREGIAKSFFPNGQLLYEERFEKDLLIEGKYYTEEGLLFTSIEKGSGKRTERENSSLKRLVCYRNGIPEGLVECFDDKGFIKTTFHQKEGKKQGEELEYYPKESVNEPLKPKLLLHWQEDVLQGTVKTWFQNGLQESQKELYQNKKNGVSFAWYKNGDLMLSEEYEKDLLIGGTYFKKGDKKPVSKVIQGKGLATLYHPDGYLLQKVTYEKGAPLLEGDSK